MSSKPFYTTDITTIKDAQRLVKAFAVNNNWDDSPNIDKFDHLHEELLEMSRFLRYQDKEERIKTIHEKRDEFVDGIGDVFFALCRLANQLEVDIEQAFNMVQKDIVSRYNQKNKEIKIIRDKNSGRAVFGIQKIAARSYPPVAGLLRARRHPPPGTARGTSRPAARQPRKLSVFYLTGLH